MNKIREKIMQMNFTKALKQLIIVALCVAVLGGGASAILLRTQIEETVNYIQQEEKNGKGYERDKESGDKESVDMSGEKMENKWHHDKEHADLEEIITKPSTAAKVVVGITGIFCALIGIGFWLMVAAWLYKAAVIAKMKGFLWFLLGLGGNVVAVVLFILIRSLIRKKCEACGSYQMVKAQFCTNCGGAMAAKCPQCDAVCDKGDKFCYSCGKSLGRK